MLEAGNLPEKWLALWMVREVKGDLKTAEELNEFFMSVFMTEDLGQILLPERPLLTDELNHLQIKREDVLNLIDKMKINKSLGPDGIHPRVIKEP